MPLADYLAANYLSADPKPPKKRKRKAAAAANPTSEQEALTIADDGANDWGDAGQNANSSADEDAPTVFGSATLAGGLNTTKPGKKPKWTTVGSAAPKDADQAAADALLADARAETRAREAEDEDASAAVETDGPTMGSGAAAGLQSAAQVTAALRRKEKAELRAIKDAGLDPAGKAQETIYRDASGRVINVAMKRAELRAKAEEEERKRMLEEEGRKGDVQRREKEERREALREVRSEGVARGADDRRMNEELKGRERWNDPMAQLLASKKEKGGGKGKAGKGKGGGRTYPGASEPNRYGIRPGWRWDGVDRSNGFEKKWFAARNAAQNRKDLEYAWTMDE